jgi:transcriptional regulator with PAS, ATPase and Fis domain
MFDQQQGIQYAFDTSRSLKDATEEFEKQYIARVLQMNEYSKENTARALKISLSSLYRKIEELKVPLQG